ncbi:hypothetical protein [Bacillus subtilis]|uniref:hypothetical protein n=1 Tax=Bacillus subtilis TaxID=1423 RepID=UPI001B970C25|nr:hypothetical protein [Bacillus subtilis]CAF1916711.1 hypothetical protein NRS6206_03893 [Bacillus subtilis]
MSLSKELAAIKDKMKDTEGLRVYKKMQALRASKYVFEKNHDELFRAINLAMTDYEMVKKSLNIKKGEKGFNSFLYEIGRLLHNYLSSAKTLIDHTRKLYQDEYKKLTFAVEYEKKINEAFTESPLARFIQDLRNYSLHREIPISGVAYSVLSDDKGLKEVYLEKKSLLEWDGWTKKSKEYLKKCKNNIDIKQLIIEYTKLIKEFQEWFLKKHKDIHRKDLDELYSLNQKGKHTYQKLIKKIEKQIKEKEK